LLASRGLYFEHVLWFSERTDNSIFNGVENNLHKRNSRKELLANCRLLSNAETKNEKKQNNIYIYKIYLFVIAYVVNSHVITSISLFACASNIMKIFAELGKLCRYESSTYDLHDVRWWRASDLLVWNSADKSCKGKERINFS